MSTRALHLFQVSPRDLVLLLFPSHPATGNRKNTSVNETRGTESMCEGMVKKAGKAEITDYR